MSTHVPIWDTGYCPSDLKSEAWLVRLFRPREYFIGGVFEDKLDKVDHRCLIRSLEMEGCRLLPRQNPSLGYRSARFRSFWDTFGGIAVRSSANINPPMSIQPCPSTAEALLIAAAAFRQRYEGASFAFVAGSIMRGQGTTLSDIDLVVVFNSLEAARRESFVFEGVPVEAFVHDPGTLAWFIDDDVSRGRPSILNMIVEGRVIGDEPERAEALRETVSVRLLAGPPALTQAVLNTLRYEITDAVDDLRGERSASELLAIGAMLYPKLAELALRGRGRWNGAGKWTPRLLVMVDQALGDRFDTAFRALFASGHPDPIIDLAQTELARHGGPLFDGDRRTAPASWRV